MKRIVLFFCIAFLLNMDKALAVLPPGSTAIDWTHADLNGGMHNLYTYLNAGKQVYIDFSATWCGPCWNYHNSHALRDLYDQYGPNGTNEVMVFFIEGDVSTNEACLYGPAGCIGGTQGNWVAGTTYPIINTLTSTIASQWQITYWPTIYTVCPSTKKVYESGQKSKAAQYSYVNSCNLNYNLQSIIDATCPASATGAVNITTIAGANPKSYNWSNGKVTEDISNVPAGNYRVTITEGNGISIVSDYFTVNEPPATVITENITNATCINKSNGVISVTTTGGNGGFNYTWTGGKTGSTISNLAPGNYSVTATDSKGCKNSENYVLEGGPLPVTEAGDPGQLTCIANEVNLDGSASESGSGITYQWTTTNGHIVSGANTLTPKVDKVGTYTLQVNNGSTGCSNTDVTTVFENKVTPGSNAGTDKSLTCTVQDVILDGNGSPKGPNFTYLWSTGDGHIVSGANTLTPTVDAGGTYSLEVTNTNNGCKSTDAAVVTVNNVKPNASAGPSKEINCGATTISLDGTGSSNGNNIVYAWTTADGNIISGANTTTPVVGKGGTYNIQVTNNSNGCISNASVVVTEDQIHKVPVSAYTSAGNKLVVNFTDNSTGVPDSWSWNFGDNTTSTLQNPTHTYPGNATYNVCLTTTNKCGTSTKCDAVTVSGGANIPVITSVSVTNATCKGGNNGDINITVIGGTPPYTYTWSNGATTEDLSGLSEGIYSVEVKDSNGEIVAANQIEVKFNFEVTINNSITTPPACNGGTNGAIALNITANGGSLTYKWEHDANLNNSVAENLPEGSYSVEVIDANGCKDTETFQLKENKPEITDAQVNHPTCFGSTNGTINITVTSGTGPYGFDWTGPNDVKYNTEDISNLDQGYWLVKITDANGCITEHAYGVTAPNDIAADITSTKCDAGKSNGTASLLNVGGGVGNFTYLWSNGATTESINGLPPGNYCCEITDGNGCKKTKCVEVQEISGTNEIKSLVSVQLYPNPASSQINFKAQFTNSITGLLEIVNVLGVTVQRTQVEGASINHEFQIDQLSAGRYIIRLITDQGVYEHSVIKE